METQMLLLEVKEESALCDRDTLPLSAEKTFYVLLLPVLEGSFRATLHGARSNELQMCVESGDANVQTTNVSELVFMNSGDNPFNLIKYVRFRRKTNDCLLQVNNSLKLK
ncbi:hypothetical protein P3S67_006405 [Capsicum chacoense]